MKILLIILMMFLSTNVYAEELVAEQIEEPIKHQVELINCTSSSNIWVSLDNKDLRISLIAYDKENGSLNKEIDNYICELLSTAKNIEVEYDESVTSLDKYNRTQVWLYVDNTLLQNDLLSKGYGQVNYVTGEYKYLTILCETQKVAISNSLGVWNYEGIKESYCKSGIKVGEKIKEDSKDKDTEKKYDIKKIHFLILLSSGIVLLLLFIRGNK